jgi:hypothetical protein
MAKDYLKEKAVKKKSAIKGSWLIVLFVVIFAGLLIKLAMSGSNGIYNGLPDSDVAYRIGRQFIQRTIRSGNATFEDSEYKFAKRSDSVYVINSSYTEMFDNGETSTTKFIITLKYNGGQGNKQTNWTMINFDEDNIDL